MSNWKPVNKTWREYKKTEDLIGRVIKTADETLLIGDINQLGGYCDDCPIGADEIVLSELDLREDIKALMGDV